MANKNQIIIYFGILDTGGNRKLGINKPNRHCKIYNALWEILSLFRTPDLWLIKISFCLAWTLFRKRLCDHSFCTYVWVCMYVVCGQLCKIDHCIHIHWCILMGLGHNDPWVESHMWPQSKWGQRSSRGHWPLVKVFEKRVTVSTCFDVFLSGVGTQ